MKYVVGIQKKVVIKTSLLKDKIYERIIKVKLLEDKGYPCVAPDITEFPYYRGEHPSDADIYSCTGDPTFHCMMVITSAGGGMAGACGTDILTSSDSYLRRDYGTDTTLRPSLNNKGWVMTRLGTSIMVPSTCNIGCRSNSKQAGVLAVNILVPGPWAEVWEKKAPDDLAAFEYLRTLLPLEKRGCTVLSDTPTISRPVSERYTRANLDHVGEPGAPLAHPDHALQVKWGVFKGNNFGHISTLKILATRACIDTTVCDQKCQMPKRLDAGIHVYSVVALEVMGKGCHLQETCNKVDCFIVVSGALEYGLDVEKLKVYQRRLLGREGLRVTPNLYYKLVEKDLIPVYISSAPHTYGMHKCDNLPYHLDLSDNCPVLPMLDGVQSVRVDEQSASEEERHEKIVKTFSQLIDSC